MLLSLIVRRNFWSPQKLRTWLLMPAGFSCYEISYILTTFIRFSRKTYRNFNEEYHEKKDYYKNYLTVEKDG
jgi:hypothetical protein